MCGSQSTVTGMCTQPPTTPPLFLLICTSGNQNFIINQTSLNAQFYPSAYYFVVQHLGMIMIKIIIVITTLHM